MNDQDDHNAARPMPWADDAACRTLPTSAFYIERGELVDVRLPAACARCPVHAACHDWALHHEAFGYWAGTSERQRKALRRALGIRLNEPTTPLTDTEDDVA